MEVSTLVLHKQEKKRLLKEHGNNYMLYKQGKVHYEDIQGEVADLEARGVAFDEIVEARRKAMRTVKSGK